MTTIRNVTVRDVRFPTARDAVGSDAMNRDADYSVAYVLIETDAPGLTGHGFTFTIGRGNDLCVEAARQIGSHLLGLDVEHVVSNLGGTYRLLTSDSQLRWLGPDKGVVHLGLAAVMNAVWDLAARQAGKPLWRLLTDMSPEDLVDTMDLSYLSDALTHQEAIALLRDLEPSRTARIDALARQGGYPCYTTSAGWLGYDDDELRTLLQRALSDGYRHVKLKVGSDLQSDIRRLQIARDIIGWDVDLLIDANQVWDVPEAISWLEHLAPFRPLWIEEPTSPDDILGHAAIRRAVSPVGVATGEHGMNRVLFKQLFQAGAIDYCQIDSARLASPSEILPVYLMAKKFEVPVCPHAGGVGLCELVQHLSVFDFVGISGTTDQRVTEYVDHLHEHFIDPCIVRDGRYRIPSKPGYSAQMHESSLDQFEFPTGAYWTRARL